MRESEKYTAEGGRVGGSVTSQSFSERLARETVMRGGHSVSPSHIVPFITSD